MSELEFKTSQSRDMIDHSRKLMAIRLHCIAYLLEILVQVIESIDVFMFPGVTWICRACQGIILAHLFCSKRYSQSAVGAGVFIVVLIMLSFIPDSLSAPIRGALLVGYLFWVRDLVQRASATRVG